MECKHENAIILHTRIIKEDENKFKRIHICLCEDCDEVFRQIDYLTHDEAIPEISIWVDVEDDYDDEDDFIYYLLVEKENHKKAIKLLIDITEISYLDLAKLHNNGLINDEDYKLLNNILDEVLQ